MTEQALEIKIGFPIRYAAIAVEYGPVTIGNKSIICPIRSISISDLQVPDTMALDGAGDHSFAE